MVAILVHDRKIGTSLLRRVYSNSGDEEEDAGRMFPHLTAGYLMRQLFRDWLTSRPIGAIGALNLPLSYDVDRKASKGHF